MLKYINATGQRSSIHPLRNADPQAEQDTSMGNNDGPCFLFTQTTKDKNIGDTTNALESLNKISGLRRLDPRQDLKAQHFLSDLIAFSEEYIKLYGVIAELHIPESRDLLPFKKVNNHDSLTLFGKV